MRAPLEVWERIEVEIINRSTAIATPNTVLPSREFFSVRPGVRYRLVIRYVDEELLRPRATHAFCVAFREHTGAIAAVETASHEALIHLVD